MVVDFYKTPVISAHDQNDRYIEYGVSVLFIMLCAIYVGQPQKLPGYPIVLWPILSMALIGFLDAISCSAALPIVGPVTVGPPPDHQNDRTTVHRQIQRHSVWHCHPRGHGCHPYDAQEFLL